VQKQPHDRQWVKFYSDHDAEADKERIAIISALDIQIMSGRP
jgi:hypothetical protein